MSHIIDNIFAEVCLDERVEDGVFKLDEIEHMNALRDRLVKQGLTLEEATQVTNKMLEGKYPERQAYRKEDGILVTWPTPKHKFKSMSENPGKYIDKNPNPNKEMPEEPDAKPTPVQPRTPVNAPEPKSVNQGGINLEIEPIKGSEVSDAPPTPPSPAVTHPTTPEEKAAHKFIVQQMMASDGSEPMSVQHPALKEQEYIQLCEVYDIAKKKNYTSVLKILDPYINLQ
jgi:hypothetical protein